MAIFDKERFAGILLAIVYKKYGTIAEMARNLGIDRGYLNKYIGIYYDNPPSVKILKKIAEASNGITTYDELMEVCGYYEIDEEYKSLISGDDEYVNIYIKDKKYQLKDIIGKMEKNISNLENYIKSIEIILEDTENCEKYRIQLYENNIERAKKEIEGFEIIIEKIKALNS